MAHRSRQPIFKMRPELHLVQYQPLFKLSNFDGAVAMEMFLAFPVPGKRRVIWSAPYNLTSLDHFTDVVGGGGCFISISSHGGSVGYCTTT